MRLRFNSLTRLQEHTFLNLYLYISDDYPVVVFHVVKGMISEIMSLIHNPFEVPPVELCVHDAEALGQVNTVYEKGTLRKRNK